MDCNQKAQTENNVVDFVTVDEPTTLTSPDMNGVYRSDDEPKSPNVSVKEKSSRQFSDVVRGLNESDGGKDLDKVASNTVDELSTMRPNLAKKSESKSRKKKKSKKKTTSSAQGNGPAPPVMTATCSEEVYYSSEESLSSTSEVRVKDCHIMHTASPHEVGENDQVVKSLTLTKSEAGKVIGTEGRRINDIQTASGASIDFIGKRDDDERNVLIEGRADQVEKAFGMIEKILTVKEMETMTISSSRIGSIIGEKGSVINEVQRRTGADIDIGGSHGDKERKVVIKGSTVQVKGASKMIKKL